MRYPKYAGYTLAHIGFLLAMPSLFNTAVYALVRISREEHVLIRYPVYGAFAERVRYRLLPGIY